jgi:hypothetical protein
MFAVTDDMLERAEEAFNNRQIASRSRTIAEFRENRRECLRAAIEAVAPMIQPSSK